MTSRNLYIDIVTVWNWSGTEICPCWDRLAEVKHRVDVEIRESVLEISCEKCRYSNIQPHTWFVIYHSIWLQFSGFVRNILNRQWFNCQHDRTLFFGVIKDFKFSQILHFTREYLTKVANSHLPRLHWHRQPLVKIWSKSVQSFLRYETWKTNANCIFRENLLTHTRIFIYQSILLKFSEYVRNTSIRMWYNFQHDRALFFGVIRDFHFTRKFMFRREYSM